MTIRCAWLDLSKLEANSRPVLANLACFCNPGIENILSQLLLSEDGYILAVKKELVDRERRVDSKVLLLAQAPDQVCRHSVLEDEAFLKVDKLLDLAMLQKGTVVAWPCKH